MSVASPDVTRRTSETEFIALFASLTALTALSIDAILPGLPAIAAEFASAPGSLAGLLGGAGDAHGVLSALVFGMAFGELLFGPLADGRGRKFAIGVGIGLFVIGALVSLLAQSYTVLLLGRFLQGIGVAGPKIGSRAAIRDRYAGDDMARAMSIIMSVLIVVPMIAPALGQAVMQYGSWRWVFVLYGVSALLGLVWLLVRQPETLPPHARRAFHGLATLRLAWRIACHPRVLCCAVVAGLTFGCLVGFYGVAPALFNESFGVGEWFPLLFAVLAAGVGTASLLNSRLVRRVGMFSLCRVALLGLFATACAFAVLSMVQAGTPGLVGFMLLQTVTMFFIGMVFGNIGAMAMEPLGAVAGTGASVVASLSSLVAFVVSLAIGFVHDASLVPHAAGLGMSALVSLWLVQIAARHAYALAA